MFLLHHRPHGSVLAEVDRLELWRADAVVLFDWLMSVDLNAVPVTHPAEKQALADLLIRLEHRRRGRSQLTVLWEKGDGGPEVFYLGLGFVPTGELFGEAVGTKDLESRD